MFVFARVAALAAPSIHNLSAAPSQTGEEGRRLPSHRSGRPEQTCVKRGRGITPRTHPGLYLPRWFDRSTVQNRGGGSP